MSFKVGQKVKVKQSASKYSTGQVIPQFVKDRESHTIAEVASGKVLLKEIYSWVNVGDVEEIKTGSSTLQTGDTMKLFDKNGKEIGTWTFKRK